MPDDANNWGDDRDVVQDDWDELRLMFPVLEASEPQPR